MKEELPEAKSSQERAERMWRADRHKALAWYMQAKAVNAQGPLAGRDAYWNPPPSERRDAAVDYVPYRWANEAEQRRELRINLHCAQAAAKLYVDDPDDYLPKDSSQLVLGKPRLPDPDAVPGTARDIEAVSAKREALLLLQLRARAAMTQQELANNVVTQPATDKSKAKHLSRALLKRYEQGLTRARDANLNAMAQTLDAQPDRLRALVHTIREGYDIPGNVLWVAGPGKLTQHIPRRAVDRTATEFPLQYPYGEVGKWLKHRGTRPLTTISSRDDDNAGHTISVQISHDDLDTIVQQSHLDPETVKTKFSDALTQMRNGAFFKGRMENLSTSQMIQTQKFMDLLADTESPADQHAIQGWLDLNPDARRRVSDFVAGLQASQPVGRTSTEPTVRH